MKKKLTAFLTAAVCALSSIGILPASASGYEEYSTYFVFITNEIGHVVCAWNGDREPDMKYLREPQMEQLFKNFEEYPFSGEIIGLNSSSWGGSEADYINPVDYGTIRKVTVVGSIYDLPTVDCYYVNATRLVDEEGKKYSYPMKMYQTGYESANGMPDLSNLNSGDKMTMAFTKEGGYPIACVALSPLGDVNADSTLNILDVILMNKAILIGEPLPALETAARSGDTDYGQCDFNGNGTLDLDDSLGMMKRILGIE